MTFVDLTSGGRLSYVLGADHPVISDARQHPDASAAANLAATLERVTGLKFLSWHATAEAARRQAEARARVRSGRRGIIACRGALADMGARLVAHGDALQTQKALEQEAAAAIVVETVQTQNGVRVPPLEYFARLRSACDAAGALLIIDETEIGFARTGTLVSWQKEDVVPDLVPLSLALAPGLDGGAVLARKELDLPPEPGELPPEVATAALATIALLEREDVPAKVRKLGKVLQKGVIEMVETRRRWAMDSRGRGLVRGLTVCAGDFLEVARLLAQLVPCLGEHELRDTGSEDRIGKLERRRVVPSGTGRYKIGGDLDDIGHGLEV
jgi:acetylornithine/succinyldiaminopimelate/putrescine aminotransferase